MQEHSESAAAQRPKIDLTAALGEAGHEVQELGYEGIPDTGPALDDHDDHDDETVRIARAHLELAITQFPID